IDTLMARIAHVRTWTYIAHRGDWLADAAAWQERARAIEDRLSDALHDRLTQRFVDRRGAFLVRQLAGAGELLAAIRPSGEVLVGELREIVRRRLAAFLRDEIRRRLAPLLRARESSLSGAGRGLVYQLAEGLGSLPAASVTAQRAALDAVDRKALARLGIRL